MAGEFSDLLATDQIGRFTEAVTKAVADSFVKYPGRMTQSAVKERFRHLEAGFRYMRGDLRWSLDRCIDSLAGFLESKLNGTPWEPSERVCWMPGDS